MSVQGPDILQSETAEDHTTYEKRPTTCKHYLETYNSPEKSVALTVTLGFVNK